MIKVGRKLWKNLSDKEKISYCEKLFNDAKESRQRRDFEWYMNYMFLEGHHYAYFNTVTNALERPPRRRGEVRLVVNKVRSSIRAIQNYATRFQPKWEIIPGDTDEETIVNARRAGKFLDYLYRKLHLEIMVKGVVDSALNTSVAWVELGWDDKAEGGLGQVVVKMHDPFDVFIDPRAYLYAGKVVGRYIVKAVKKPLEEIKYDEKYDEKARKQVKADDELAASPMKARIIRKELGFSDSESIKRATVKEFFLWEDEPNEKGGNIRLVTYAGDQVLRDEPLKNKEYPIYLCQIPQDPLKIYHRAWTTDAIPLNKALDRSISQKIMYVNQALVYRIIAEKGHGVNVIHNENGEVIEVNKGRQYEQMRMLPLPSALDSLTSELNTYIEDILGAHDAALGRMPVGARSGKVLEALQAADANNLANIRESLESFLSILGLGILDIVAEKYVTSRVIKLTEPEEGSEYMRVIGEKAPDKAKRKGAAIITKDNELIVKIGSWLGHTREAQRETLMELARLGGLPWEEVLRQFEFPNVEDLSRRAREQRLEQHALDAEIAGRTGPSVGVGTTVENDMVRLADEENTRMMNGEDIPPTEGATPEHTQAHIDFSNSATFQEASEDIKAMIINHYEGELASERR